MDLVVDIGLASVGMVFVAWCIHESSCKVLKATENYVEAYRKMREIKWNSGVFDPISTRKNPHLKRRM